MRIATLGAGNIGGNLGILWARAGHEVVFSSRHPEQLDDLVAEAGPNASATDPVTAVAGADVVLDALPFATSLQLDPDLVAGKVVVTAANHYPGRDGEIDLDGTTQAGAIAARLPDSRVVKAFNMMAAGVMRQHIDEGEGTGAVVLVAGDDPEAVAIAEQLVRDALFTPVVTGGLPTGAGFEPGTEVYGTRMTVDEARRHFGLEDGNMTDSSGTRLVALPDGLADTRDALHQLAFFVLAPRRHAAVGRLGLVASPGGFATSWFDDEGSPTLVRMDGVELVIETEDQERRTRPGSVRDACDFLEMPYREQWFDDFHDPLPPRDPDEALAIDEEAAAVLATWFAFGTAVLEELRATAGAVDPSTVQLWPEHFDPAVEVGSADLGRRASYGASPGDADHPEPYLYVAPWGDLPDDAWFDEPAFAGASLGHDELLASDDPFASAVAFLRHGHDLVASETDPR